MDSPVAARQALRTLTDSVISAAAASGKPITNIRGSAFFDTSRDAFIEGQPSFRRATEELSRLALVQGRFGANEGRRIALQFVYQILKRLEQPVFSEAVFDGVWEAFTTELENPDWIYRAVSNVRYFRYDKQEASIAGGVTIRGRSFDELLKLGFGDHVLAGLAEDWSGFGASSFVLVIEQRLKKAPENVVTSDDGSLWLNAQRALGALRLLGPGDIAMGTMWVVRPAAFDLSLGSGHVGATIPTMGSEYVLTDRILADAPALYAELQHLEELSYKGAPGNLGLALRSFMATYDRWPSFNDSRLIDSVTALEALLGTDTEISFKLAFRVAGLLANTEVERAALFQELKSFYDARSRLVHGGELEKKHHAIIDNVDVLRIRVRRLLRCFVALAARGTGAYTKKFFKQELDSTLLDASKREALRRALRLNQ